MSKLKNKTVKRKCSEQQFVWNNNQNWNFHLAFPDIFQSVVEHKIEQGIKERPVLLYRKKKETTVGLLWDAGRCPWHTGRPSLILGIAECFRQIGEPVQR